MQAEVELSGRGLRDRILLIKSLEGLRDVDDDEALKLLAEYARERRFSRGEMLLREGAPIRFVYFPLSGQIEVRRFGKLVSRVRRGRGVGMLSVLSRDPVGVDAEAQEDLLALELPAAILVTAYEENFSLVRNALRNGTKVLLEARGNLPVRPGEAEEPQMGTHRERAETLVERIIKARESPLFRSVNLDAVVDLCRRMKEVRVGPGTPLWNIGDRGSFMFRVDYGKVRATSGSGESVVVGAGFALGAMDALGDHARSYSAVTESDVIGVRNDGEAMMAVLESNPELAMDMIAMVTGELLKGN